MSTKKTIRLTDRRPVSIDPKQWAIISSDTHHDGEIPEQANRTWAITVRQHADGRRLVYGSFSSAFRHEINLNGGYLVSSKDGTPNDAGTIEAIKQVAKYIEQEQLGHDVIQGLPEEEI